MAQVSANKQRLSWPTGVWATQSKRTPFLQFGLCHLDGPHLRAMTLGFLEGHRP